MYRDGSGQTMRMLDGSGRESGVYGLYWDDQDNRLYWSYGDGYNTTSADDPSVGCSALDDISGRTTAFGAWRFPELGCKASMGGVLPIPAWFSQKYCPGQRLGAGFGGYFSVATIAPISAGPALAAFAPPEPGENPQASALEHTPLVGYPFNAEAYI